ncbi:MAG: cytochrome c [Verrucomicrobiales bacterium]|nr:cytochrome c [Verrucomicrobiales bacterium]
MRWFFLILFIVTVAVVSAIGVRGTRFTQPPMELFPDMDRQYKVKYQKPSSKFADGNGNRMPVSGTVPIGFELPKGDARAANGKAIAEFGFSHSDDYYNSGTFGDFYGDGLPSEVKVDAALLKRGQQQFQIKCSMCHGASGNGKSAVANYWLGFPPTANLMAPLMKDAPDGQIFWTMTNGKGLMGSYKGIITVQDRWAIVAYIRALQFSSSAKNEGEVKKAFEQASK